MEIQFLPESYSIVRERNQISFIYRENKKVDGGLSPAKKPLYYYTTYTSLLLFHKIVYACISQIHSIHRLAVILNEEAAFFSLKFFSSNTLNCK